MLLMGYIGKWGMGPGERRTAIESPDSIRHPENRNPDARDAVGYPLDERTPMDERERQDAHARERNELVAAIDPAGHLVNVVPDWVVDTTCDGIHITHSE